MLNLDVQLRRRIVWRLVVGAYCLECIVERLMNDQLSVVRILENGRELHVEHWRSQDRLEALSREYMGRFQEALRRTG
jgi:hypothetical protein